MKVIEKGFYLNAKEYAILLEAMEIAEKIASCAKSRIFVFDSSVLAGTINDFLSDYYKGEE